MRYLSTRGRAPEQGFLGILLSGLAPDGGLYLPAYYPQVSVAERTTWRGLDYPDLASALLGKFIDDIPAATIDALCRRTYTAEVYSNARDPAVAPAITPLRWLEPGLGLLELSNGPTLAFKDMAMQLLGGLFEYALAQAGDRLNVLGATSGDTGSAAEYALRGKRGINVFMLSPHGRMSVFQRAQMYSLADPNIFNLAIEGTFDDCQDIVKHLAGDLAFKRRMRLGAVNSINWARVVAQVVYYFKGYFAATQDDSQSVSFTVPSGNFGNILAGWIAKQMGLPIEQLVLATNENNVLDEFLRTGRYRVRSAAQATSSPSMDISKASNFERFIFDVTGRDPEVLRELWWQIDTAGEFNLSASPFWEKVRRTGFVSGSSTHANRLATIREVYAASELIIDPHTADGVKVAREYRRPNEPMICLETAQPAKFSSTIVEALGREPPRPAAFAHLEARPQRFEVLPADAQRVMDYLVAHAGQDAVDRE
jgi:threonine synthase